MSLIQESKGASPHGYGSDRYFRNTETGEEYRRIYGGFAFPSGSREGFAVIVAEDRYLDPEVHQRLYKILTYYESNSVIDLVDRCLEFKTVYRSDPLFGDADSPLVEVIRRSHPSFHLQRPPQRELSLTYFVVLIQSLTAAGKKKLHFNDPLLTGRLMEVEPQRIQHGQLDEFPLLSAIGFCLCALETLSGDPGKEDLEVARSLEELAIIHGD